MDKIDARSVGRPAQQMLRRQAIRLRNAGRTFREIAEALGVHESTVRKWWKIYKEEGAQALRLKNGGENRGNAAP